MGAHTVVLDLLQIPYEKVGKGPNSPFLCFCASTFSERLFILLVCPNVAQSDEKMNEIMTLAHTFLQNFCRGNPQNQVLLHKHLNLFLTPGVR